MSTIEHALQAVALVRVGRSIGRTFAVATDDPTSWFDIWPMALADIDVQPVPIGQDLVELARLDLAPEVRAALLWDAVDLLWTAPEVRSSTCVYVTKELSGHPALDAWISTGLHALADRGDDPRLVADPRVRGELHGYRSELLSIERLLDMTAIVVPACEDLELCKTLAPTVVFDPFDERGLHARTRRDLDAALRALSERSDSTRSSASSAPVDLEDVIRRLFDTDVG